MAAGIDISPHTVLRAVQGHQVHFGCFEEDIDGRAEVAVHAAGVGHQPYTLALQFPESVFLEYVDACEHLGFHRQAKSNAQSGDEEEAKTHKLLIIKYYKIFLDTIWDQEKNLKH